MNKILLETCTCRGS